MIRRQPPVHSPTTWGAIGAAWGAALGVGAGDASADLAAALRAAFGADDVLLTDSGTSALALAIAAALDLTPGAPVALPAYACYDVATAADAAQAPVVLYDVDPETLAPLWDSVDAALAAGARALVVVHLYGYPVDVPRALERARRARATLIEDAAQGAGAHLGGRPAGALGPLSVLSFGRGKGLTGGAGGALLARGDGVALLDRARSRVGAPATPWRGLAALTAQHVLSHPRVYGIPAALPWLKLGETIYRPAAPPRRMSAAAAVAARRALAAHDVAASARRLRAETMEGAARAGTRLAVTRRIAGAEPGYLRLAGRLAAGATLDLAVRRLGVMPSYPRALADLEGFGSRVRQPAAAVGARELAGRLVTLPTHGLLRPGDLAALEAWLRG